MFRYRPLTLALLAALAHSGAQAEGSDAQRLLIEQGHFWQAQDNPKRAGEVWQKLLLIDAAQPDALYGLGFIAVKDGDLASAAGYLQRLQAIQPLLPPALRSAIQAGPIEGPSWCLLVKGNAAAAKLRQLAPALAAHLRSKGWDVQGIRLKVQ